MITAGIDVGSLTTKVVILNQDKIMAYEVLASSVDIEGTTQKAMNAVLEKADISLKDVESIACTGAGKKKIPYQSKELTEIMCDAKGTLHLYPKVNGVIDIGGEHCRAIKCDTEGNVIDFALNDKCASGTGIFLDAMAKALRVKPEEMGELSLQATEDIEVTSMCSVFAESEVVTMIHKKVSKNNILRGIHKSIASRVVGLANRILLEGDVVIIGGIAKNVGLLENLDELMNSNLIVPEKPEIVGALGAALLAREGRA
ncbi:MAG: acyl-CoA dehydratase activase [Pseudomonadota bacterium]